MPRVAPIRRCRQYSGSVPRRRSTAASGASRASGAKAERASVLIAGPLGLCYLPAFVALGVAPVIAGLAGDVLRSGVL